MTESQVHGMLAQAIDLDGLRDLFPGDIADTLRDVVAGVLSMLGDLSDEQKQAVLDAVKSFYDSYVRPLDIPYIPAIAEKYVDDYIWLSIESLLRSRLGL